MPKFKFIAVMVPEIKAFKNENSGIAQSGPFSQILSHLVTPEMQFISHANLYPSGVFIADLILHMKHYFSVCVYLKCKFL